MPEDDDTYLHRVIILYLLLIIHELI
jgi:hypothetical protein